MSEPENSAKPIIVFREWGVEEDLLTARYRNYLRGGKNPWGVPGKTVSAVCPKKPRDHTPGQSGCTCGLYGYYEIPRTYETPILEHVRPADTSIFKLTAEENFVFGAFLAFGETTKHRRGLRSEKGLPVALRWSPLAEKVAERYDLPLCDTPGELRAAGLQMGELFDPATLPPPRPVIVDDFPSASYRNPQHYLWHGQSRPSPKVRVICTLLLFDTTRIAKEEGVEPLQVRFKIVGLSEAWVVKTVTERMDRNEVPLVGREKSVAYKPGARQVEVQIEAVLGEAELDREMIELTKLGRVFSREMSRC
jgi:hypothetical protein